MGCIYCTELPQSSWPPSNLICLVCYEAQRGILLLTKKIENDKSTNNNLPSSSNSCKGFVKALKLTEEMNREMNQQKLLSEKITYLSGFANALRDQIHTDILIVPGGDNEPSIPSHRALLATRSTIFRNMLDSDQCKAPVNKTITLPELSREELDALLEFLYSGSLPKEKMEKHVFSLAITADKYEIPFLQKFCANEMLGSLNASNALDILEISDTCSNQNLKEAALSFIVRNMDEIVFSSSYDAFVIKNPHLTTQITRASLMDIKKRKIGVIS